MKNSQKGFVIPLLIAIIAVLIIGVVGISYYQKNQQDKNVMMDINLPSPNTNQTVATSTNPAPSSVTGDQIKNDTVTSDGYFFAELFRTNSRVFWCKSRAHTESSCSLFTSDLNGNKSQDLNINVENSSNIFASPDKNNLIAAEEQKATLINTAALTQKGILQVSGDQVLGTYTGFPSFEGKVHWIDNTKISISIYNKNDASADGNPPPKPIEEKVVSI